MTETEQQERNALIAACHEYRSVLRRAAEKLKPLDQQIIDKRDNFFAQLIADLETPLNGIPEPPPIGESSDASPRAFAATIGSAAVESPEKPNKTGAK